MTEPWPTSTPREDLLSQVATTGQRRLRLRRLGAFAAAGGIAAAAAVGVGVGRSGGVDLVGEPTSVVIDAQATVAFSACPGTARIGDLHRDDRVFLTGRSEDGAWLELRAPGEPLARVWVQAGAVGADAEVDGLSVSDCRTDGDQLARRRRA